MSPDFYETEIKLFDPIPCHKHLSIKLPTQEKTDDCMDGNNKKGVIGPTQYEKPLWPLNIPF